MEEDVGIQDPGKHHLARSVVRQKGLEVTPAAGGGGGIDGSGGTDIADEIDVAGTDGGRKRSFRRPDYIPPSVAKGTRSGTSTRRHLGRKVTPAAGGGGGIDGPGGTDIANKIDVAGTDGGWKHSFCRPDIISPSVAKETRSRKSLRRCHDSNGSGKG